MSIELIVASVAITCALVLYTFGVFGERRSGTLALRHVLLFWGGLVCDTAGTMIMSNIAQQSSAGGFGIHAVTGLLAIVLMLVHAVWATVTYVRHNERGMHRFHTFSTFVWLAGGYPDDPSAGGVRHRHQRRGGCRAGVRAVPRREGSCAYRRALGVGFQSRERHARSLSNPGSRSGDPGFACLRMLAFAGQDGR